MKGASIQQVVDGLLSEATRKAAATVAVRRSEAQTATVTAVNSDGTVNVGDIRARRMEGYQSPAVGDRIVLQQFGNGNWIAAGRLVPAAAADTAWTSIPLAAGFTTPHVNFGTAQYRVITVHGTTRVELRGTADPAAALTSITAFSTALPAAARPSVIRTWTVRRNYSLDTKGSVAMEVSTGGVLSVYGSAAPNSTSWFALDGSHYDL